MLCDNCNKNEATVHYTEVINGKKSERHLCSECLKELKNGGDMEFPFSNLLKGILSAHLIGTESDGMDNVNIKCNGCGMTYSEFTREGKFGCSSCYSVFGPLILNDIKKIQGSATHRGKQYKKYIEEYNNFVAPLEEKSVRQKSNSKKSILEEQLMLALREEDYMKAAALRDEIKAIKEE